LRSVPNFQASERSTPVAKKRRPSPARCSRPSSSESFVGLPEMMDHFPDGLSAASDFLTEVRDGEDDSPRSRSPSPLEDRSKFASTWDASSGERPGSGMCAQLINLTRAFSDTKLLSEVDWLDPLSRPFSLTEKPQRMRTPVSKPKMPLRRSMTPSIKVLPGGRDRGKAVLSALYDMRHAGNPNVGSGSDAGSDAGSKAGSKEGRSTRASSRVPSHVVKNNPGEELTLLEFTLVDCNDTPEQLREGLELICKGQDIVTELKNSRHPTMLGAARAHQVMRRKLEVLEPLVQGIRQFEELSSRKQEVVKAVEAGAKPTDIGPEAIKLSVLIEDSVHKRPAGCPEKADRLNWELFVSTFKLPRDHGAFYQAEAAIERETEEWMDLVIETAIRLVEAEKQNQDGDTTSHSPAAEVVKNLFNLMEGMAIAPDHPKLVKTDMLANAQKCRKLLAFAKAQHRDTMGTTSSKELREVAESLRDNILQTVRWGVNRTHPDLMKSMELACMLRAEGVRQHASKLMRMKRSRVGEAERAALDIEDEITEAQEFGCPFDMETIQAARSLSLKLREEEGLRKRQANSEKKHAAAAQSKAS